MRRLTSALHVQVKKILSGLTGFPNSMSGVVVKLEKKYSADTVVMWAGSTVAV